MVKKIIGFLKSVRLAIFLLILLAIACIIGTLLPQNQPSQVYVAQFGQVGARFIKSFCLYDLYHAPWFQVLLIIFTINLLVCSLDRFPKTWRILKHAKEVKDKSFFHHLPLSDQFECNIAFEQAKGKISAFLKGKGQLSKVPGNPEHIFFLKKGQISLLGPYILHAGILVILLGGLITSMKGFSGMMIIPEGGRTNTIFLQGRRHHQVYNLPFSLECEKFVVEYYENGRPKEYRSYIKLIDGKKTLKTTIKVNSPLDYKGFRFYQASFGVAQEPTILLEVKDKKTGKSFELKVPFRKPVPLPNKDGVIELAQAVGDFRNLGPAFLLLLKKNGGKERQVLLFSNFPEFDAMHRKGSNYFFVVKDFTHYTGLEVKKDPGVWIVWAGCLILVGGLMITFFIVPRSFWVMIEPSRKGSKIWVGGMAHKRKQAFRDMFEEWTKEIKEVVGCGT